MGIPNSIKQVEVNIYLLQAFYIFMCQRLKAIITGTGFVYVPSLDSCLFRVFAPVWNSASGQNNANLKAGHIVKI